MRAVIETNVLVRATKNATGPARQILRCFESESHILILSQFILTEPIRVLNYPRVQALHQLRSEECAEYVSALHELAEVVAVPVCDPNQPLSSDPDDDPVILTAAAGRADVICTLDQHFRQDNVQAYCSRHGIRIATDIEFLAMLRELS